MMVNIKEDPSNKVVWKEITNIKKSINYGISKAFYNIGKKLVLDAKNECLKPKHGRTYLIRLGKQKKMHVASAAGEAPATITRALLRAHTTTVHGTKRMDFGINDSVVYGRALEFGYPPRNLAPRKWLISTIQRNQKNIENYFNNKIKIELSK